MRTGIRVTILAVASSAALAAGMFAMARLLMRPPQHAVLTG